MGGKRGFGSSGSNGHHLELSFANEAPFFAAVKQKVGKLKKMLMAKQNKTGSNSLETGPCMVDQGLNVVRSEPKWPI